MENQIFNIPVFLASVRTGRRSDRVAKFALDKLTAMPQIHTELIDLAVLDLPIMKERLRMDPNAPENVRLFSKKLQDADALLVVAPEYNFGIGGATKNAFDFLSTELKRKPLGLISVSSGAMGGIHLTTAFRSLAATFGAFMVPELFPVTKVEESFDAEGKAIDPLVHKRAETFFNELLWMTSAIKMKKESEKITPLG